jgi:hypothetical protein
MELRVSEDGLRAEAGRCDSLARSLAGASVPSAVGSSALASWAAVNAAHAQIAAAGIRCGARIQATATKLAVASAGFGENEARSAADFRLLGRTTVC